MRVLGPSTRTPAFAGAIPTSASVPACQTVKKRALRGSRVQRLAISASAAPAESTERPPRARRERPSTPRPPPISVTDDALRHLTRMRAESGGEDMLLRVGVKAGGCSGMSYTMDFEEAANVNPAEDRVINYDGGFSLVVYKSDLMFLNGLTLDYSNKLIGGGLLFQNPNAKSECGCGSSFGV